jgi:hypothetical protein
MMFQRSRLRQRRSFVVGTLEACICRFIRRVTATVRWVATGSRQ